MTIIRKEYIMNFQLYIPTRIVGGEHLFQGERFAQSRRECKAEKPCEQQKSFHIDTSLGDDTRIVSRLKLNFQSRQGETKVFVTQN